ncbi:hypothetical protein DER44DRAFT_846810 [Fusarium oxysporum]|nr:hypothetical protein DER44DRAFT_846810 [Fusarium oxysporum]
MQRLAEGARVRFDLLRSIHPILYHALPTVASAADKLRLTAPHLLQDDITLLRSDFRSLLIKLQYVDIERVDGQNGLERLVAAFDSLFFVFEGFVQQTAALETQQQSYNVERGNFHTAQKREVNTEEDTFQFSFPMLINLRDLSRQVHRKETTSDDSMWWAAQIPLQEVKSLASHVHFPISGAQIRACREHLEKFSNTISAIFHETPGRWNVDSQLEVYTSAEFVAIQEARQFCLKSSSLFTELVKSVVCGRDHVAWLHLSGFGSGLLELLVCKCQGHNWIPTFFDLTNLPAEQCVRYHVCSDAAFSGPNEETELSQGLSNFWGSIIQEGQNKPPRLSDLLQRVESNFEGGPMGRSLRLQRLDRKLIGVFLAWSLFMLYGSPWLQQEWQDDILIVAHPRPTSQLDNRRPLISCMLQILRSDTRPHVEDVAALGVLILELEANRLAKWTEDDMEFDTGKRSNLLRLARILRDQDWFGELSDGYREIAMACLEFESLLGGFDHPRFEGDLKCLAILYKRIVNPAFQLLVSDFGAATQAFRSIPVLSVPKRHKRHANQTKAALFDDFEISSNDEKVQYAQSLWDDFELFRETIRTLRSTPPCFAESIWGSAPPRPIRIAILDSGIDSSDKQIKAALRSRICATRSWVGSSIDDHRDTYGHGTHVAKLLLKMALAANIYVARICEGKHLGWNQMSQIAQAIDYAVTEWNVDIISMSFGFYDRNNEINAAIDRALGAGKLLFAAASNEGGNRGRSRPARSSNVFCIHACDGKGNKGSMNPNPERNSDNFTALGVAVESKWKGETVYKSGTSFATPIAAGIAANVLEFAGLRCGLSPHQMARLKRFEGMQAVFRAMVSERDGYDYLNPLNLWDEREDEEVARHIREIIQDL